jgi:hypothetical protein
VACDITAKKSKLKYLDFDKSYWWVLKGVARANCSIDELSSLSRQLVEDLVSSPPSHAMLTKSVSCLHYIYITNVSPLDMIYIVVQYLEITVTD